MYLGEKKMNIHAKDNGIVAAVAPKAETEAALFVPEAWGQEVSAPVAETSGSVEPSLVEQESVQATTVGSAKMSVGS